MTKVKCMIVDDEPLAIQLIENHVSKLDQLEVIATCNSPIKAFEILREQEVDLLFLDIKMSDMNGLEFLRTLNNPPTTIFTTAHREFAIDSYELQALDYLLKPITFQRFYKAVDRFLRNFNAEIKKEKMTQKEEEFIVVRAGSKHHKIWANEITYVESKKDYITLHTSKGAAISAKYKISSIQEELNPDQFLRVHRSFIINTEKIKAFTLHEIDIENSEIPIGASYKDQVIQFLDQLKK